MDVVVTSSINGAEPQHLQYDSLHAEAATPRRQMRYTSPDLSTSRSPRRTAEASAAMLRASPSSDEGYPAMSHSSPTILPFSAGAVVREAESNDTDILLEVDGQNHDRMETDMETDDSESDHQLHDGVENSGNQLMEASRHTDGEIMDMTPDSPSAAEPSHQSDPGPVDETSNRLSPSSSTQNTATLHQPPLQNDLDQHDSSSANDGGPATPRDNTTLENPTDLVVPSVLPEDSQPETADLGTLRSQSERPPPPPVDPADPAASGWENVPPGANWEGDHEEDTQDDDSTDEEDYSFWANLKEDTSGPDQEELRAIEESGHETNALDHEHWERYVYEHLDDPEYLAGFDGRISWTVHGVNGTAEKPNKDRVMRSPSVPIGDYYWNIKYYPRGNPNEGTEQLSIYIECSNQPYENERSEDTLEGEDWSNPNGQHHPGSTHDSEPGWGGSHSAAPEAADSMVMEDNEPQQPAQDGDIVHPSQLSPTELKSDVTGPWEVAAQIGCLIYNPEEPRVNVSQKSSHRYCNENPDWGWTRFHGPWDEIHKRQRFKRQALLRNDTLSFTAYIRIVHDDTGALWWHPPKDKTEWNSITRVGLKRLVHETSHSSALIAALSSWLYLSPIRDLISYTQVPDLFTAPRNRPKPMIDALQFLVHDAFGSSEATSFKASLDEIANIISWYGEDSYNSKSDVVATWETLRRILSYEASDVKNVADAEDRFPDIQTLKQLDTKLDNDIHMEGDHMQQSTHVEPSSTQEAVELAFRSILQGSSENIHENRKPDQQYPSVLQVELHRQSYCATARRWKKLTHHISIDETISIHPSQFRSQMQYTLFGMIVHSGALEASDYYSVIRPAGPGTTWIKYAGSKDPKGVTRLTARQACKAHEGRGESTEGPAAVAYVVSYVRTDRLSKILRTDQPPRESIPSDILDMSGPGAVISVDQIERKRSVPFQVYSSEIFKGYSGRGILDPWDPSMFSNKQWPVIEHELKGSNTLADIEHYITKIRKEAGESRRFRLWPLDTQPRSSIRGSPRFALALEAGRRLDELLITFGGCRFWLQDISADEVDDMITAENPPVAIVQMSLVPMEAVEESSNSNPILPDGILHEQAPVIPNGGSSQQDVANVSLEASAQSPFPDGSQNTANSLNPETPGAPDHPITSHAHETSTNEDIPMRESQEDESREVEPHKTTISPTRAELSFSWVSSSDSPPKAHIERVYILIKVFDCTHQTLVGIGGLFAKREEKIGEVVRRFLSLDPADKFDVYNEKSLLLHEKDRVNVYGSFEGIDNSLFLDGSVFIVQHRSPAAEVAKLELEGKCTNPIDFFAWLRHQDVSSYLQAHHVQSYFGSSYLSSAQQYGRPHGAGVLVTMAGDAYSGNFVAGSMCGAGTMAYANGDTYTGLWQWNEPNGQGKMVYAKTGNVYIGGFKKRKRHGKGTMHFEVADEEMAMCNICYEEEMNALFYDCGHVTACEQCAKQVDICPVCRKSVRAVVKIWRT